MYPFTLSELIFLKDRYSEAMSCDDLQNRIRKRIVKKLVALRGGLPPTIDAGPLDNISNSMDPRVAGCCFVYLADSATDPAKVHYFTLFNLAEGIFRLEAYTEPEGRLYGPRLVEWPTYLEDLDTLAQLEPSSQRIAYWNGLFSARETEDSGDDIIIHVNFVVFE